MADLIVLKNRANPSLTRIFPKRAWDFQHDSGDMKKNWEYSHNYTVGDEKPPQSEIQRQMQAAKQKREAFIPTEVKALEEKLKSKANENLQNPAAQNRTRTSDNGGRVQGAGKEGMAQAIRDNAADQSGEGKIPAAGSEGEVLAQSSESTHEPAPRKRGRPAGKTKAQTK